MAKRFRNRSSSNASNDDLSLSDIPSRTSPGVSAVPSSSNGLSPPLFASEIPEEDEADHHSGMDGAYMESFPASASSYPAIAPLVADTSSQEMIADGGRPQMKPSQAMQQHYVASPAAMRLQERSALNSIANLQGSPPASAPATPTIRPLPTVQQATSSLHPPSNIQRSASASPEMSQVDRDQAPQAAYFRKVAPGASLYTPPPSEVFIPPAVYRSQSMQQSQSDTPIYHRRPTATASQRNARANAVYVTQDGSEPSTPVDSTSSLDVDAGQYASYRNPTIAMLAAGQQYSAPSQLGAGASHPASSYRGVPYNRSGTMSPVPPRPMPPTPEHRAPPGTIARDSPQLSIHSRQYSETTEDEGSVDVSKFNFPDAPSGRPLHFPTPPSSSLRSKPVAVPVDASGKGRQTHSPQHSQDGTGRAPIQPGAYGIARSPSGSTNAASAVRIGTSRTPPPSYRPPSPPGRFDPQALALPSPQQLQHPAMQRQRTREFVERQAADAHDRTQTPTPPDSNTTTPQPGSPMFRNKLLRPNPRTLGNAEAEANPDPTSRTYNARSPVPRAGSRLGVITDMSQRGSGDESSQEQESHSSSSNSGRNASRDAALLTPTSSIAQSPDAGPYDLSGVDIPDSRLWNRRFSRYDDGHSVGSDHTMVASSAIANYQLNGGEVSHVSASGLDHHGRDFPTLVEHSDEDDGAYYSSVLGDLEYEDEKGKGWPGKEKAASKPRTHDASYQDNLRQQNAPPKVSYHYPQATSPGNLRSRNGPSPLSKQLDRDAVEPHSQTKLGGATSPPPRPSSRLRNVAPPSSMMASVGKPMRPSSPPMLRTQAPTPPLSMSRSSSSASSAIASSISSRLFAGSPTPTQVPTINLNTPPPVSAPLMSQGTEFWAWDELNRAVPRKLSRMEKALLRKVEFGALAAKDISSIPLA